MAFLPRTKGYVLLLIIVMMLLFGIGGILYKYSQSGSSVTGLRSAQMAGRFDKLDTALVNYIKANGRLPCPAAPTDSTGGAAAAASTTCATPAGVLPWGALGLSLDEALDSWDRKISYRVYDGATGFTQTGGIDATNCNSSSLLTSTAVSLLPSGLCAATPKHGTMRADFFAGKGLTVSDLSASKTGIAYVLISHGATGYGSYGADHTATRYTSPSSSSEIANASAPVNHTYYILTETDSTVDAASTSHFDDMLRYKSTSDLVTLAGLDARDWGWVSLAKSFSTANLIVNANTTPTSTLTFIFANTDANAATLTSTLTDSLPSLAVAAAPNYSTTCGGTAYSPTTGTTTLTVPIGFSVPAATGSGASKVNGSCTMSVDVYGVGTTPATLTNTIVAGTSSGGGLQTSAGWNLSAATSNSITTTFNAPTATAISPSPVTGSNSAQPVTIAGTGFVNGATVRFNNVTLSQTYVVTATSVSLTSLTASQNFTTSSGSWTASVTNPDGQSTGTVSFYVYGSSYDQTALTAASLSTALGYAVTAGSSTGTGTINFNDFTLTSFVSGYPNIASLNNSGFNGIGVATSSGTTSEITFAHTGGLRITLPAPYRYFGVTLFRFGISSGGAVERASVTFYDASGALLTTMPTEPLTLLACNTGTGTQAASYVLDPGASFSKVEITALTRTVSGTASSFQLGELAFCLSNASCVTTYSANNNASNCPYP